MVLAGLLFAKDEIVKPEYTSNNNTGTSYPDIVMGGLFISNLHDSAGNEHNKSQQAEYAGDKEHGVKIRDLRNS